MTEQAPAKVTVERLYKIFGDAPEQVRRRFEEGATKDEILHETGNVLAVADVSFSVPAGEIFVVMGLSGSGKSTLIRCLNRLFEPTFGQVYIEGEDIVAADEERLRELRRNKCSMVFQHFGLFPHKTVRDNVEFGLKMQGVEQSERHETAMRALEMVGLKEWAERRPENLSGGMQQRVGLARALATNSDVLLMDEAFSALDPLIRREMQDELLQLQKELSKTIIFITHDLNEALKLGDRTAIMRDGSIVQVGSAEEIVSQPTNEYVFEFTRDVDRGRVLTVGSIMRGADTLVQGRDTVRTAMTRLRAADTDYMVYVDSQRKPIGLILEEEVARATRASSMDLDQIVMREHEIVQTETLLMDVFDAASSGNSLIVVDENGRLKGVAEQLDILANLSVDGSTNPPPPAVESEGEASEDASEEETAQAGA